MLRGNKGEWSELYVLLRLLADGKIYAADEKLNTLKDIYFPIKRIFRDETFNNVQEIKEYEPGDTVSIYINGVLVKELSKCQFEAESDYLLSEITNRSNTSAFSIERTQAFMNSIFCYKLTAPSADKTDITMKIVDINTGYSPNVGFSIKSELGSPPTLLNASRATNFIFEVFHNDVSLINEVNEIFLLSRGNKQIDLRNRISRILEKHGKIIYRDMSNETFNDNLILIDSSMDKIIAETLLYYYRDGISKCELMMNQMEIENPMNYGNINAYRYKFKKFLAAVALGMRPATVWTGIDEASGGYIIVTREGGVLAYHIYNRNYFEEYLLQNTKYETGSTHRHNFGTLYDVEGRTFIDLNLQVRFI